MVVNENRNFGTGVGTAHTFHLDPKLLQRGVTQPGDRGIALVRTVCKGRGFRLFDAALGEVDAERRTTGRFAGVQGDFGDVDILIEKQAVENHFLVDSRPAEVNA